MLREFFELVRINVEKIYPGRGLLDTVLLIACIEAMIILAAIYIMIRLEERKEKVIRRI